MDSVNIQLFDIIERLSKEKQNKLLEYAIKLELDDEPSVLHQFGN